MIKAYRGKGLERFIANELQTKEKVATVTVYDEGNNKSNPERLYK